MDDLALAHHLADLADEITRAAYRPGEPTAYSIKGDGSPVTEYDRHVEEAIREKLARHRPDDAVVGEEIGTHGRAPRRWVIDGIDGTVSFVEGDPRWATQIALMEADLPLLGISTSPAQSRRWWASTTTRACTAALSSTGRGPAEQLAVSTVADLSGATVTSIPPRERLTSEQADLFDDVLGAGTYIPPTTHGAKMVAAGDADACLQLRGELWDYAALTVIVERAGGAVTSLDGPRRLDSGGPMLFSNGSLG